jgi:hypothetical protein
MKQDVFCFEDVFNTHKPYIVMDAGLRVVSVDRVVGTVGKCGELDRNFRYVHRLSRTERRRREKILTGMVEFNVFPPIDVYLHRGSYYVVDGNRRISACKMLGVEFIDAYVKEYIYRDDQELINGALSRRKFEQETGLKHVELVNETGYAVLQKDISLYPGELPVREKAVEWYSSVFLRALKEIKDSKLIRRYPTQKPQDIYVIIVRFYHEFMGGLPQGVSFGTVISGFTFAHRIPQRRLLRAAPLRLVHRILFNKARRPEKLG